MQYTNRKSYKLLPVYKVVENLPSWSSSHRLFLNWIRLESQLFSTICELSTLILHYIWCAFADSLIDVDSPNKSFAILMTLQMADIIYYGLVRSSKHLLSYIWCNYLIHTLFGPTLPTLYMLLLCHWMRHSIRGSRGGVPGVPDPAPHRKI